MKQTRHTTERVVRKLRGADQPFAENIPCDSKTTELRLRQTQVGAQQTSPLFCLKRDPAQRSSRFFLLELDAQ